MKKILLISLILITFSQIKADDIDFNRIVDVFVSWAKMQQNEKEVNSVEYVMTMKKLENEKHTLVTKLASDTMLLNDFIEYLKKNKKIEAIAFQDVIYEIYQKITADTATGNFNNRQLQSAHAINSLLDYMRNFSKLTFNTENQSSKEHPLVTLTRAIYEYNPDVDKIAKDYNINYGSRGFATDVMITAFNQFKKGELSKSVIEDISSITSNAFYKGVAESYVTPGVDTIEVFTHKTDNFLIYYQIEGRNAVYESHVDVDGNGIPDYVDRVGEYFEKSLKFQTEKLNFLKPSTIPEFEVKISNMRDYGITIPLMTDEFYEDCYIQIHNNYQESFFNSKGVEGAKVTAAHELFHAVSGRYGLFSNQALSASRWFAEGCAVWMEDAIFPEVRDYLSYVNTSTNVYFDKPDFPIFDLYHSESYIAVLWFKFLTENIILSNQSEISYIEGNHLLKALWEDVKKNNYSGIEAHIGVFSNNMKEIYRNFSIGRYTGEIFNHYDLFERELYIVNSEKTSFPYNKSVVSYDAPKVFGSNYFVFEPESRTSNIINIDFESDYAYPVTLLTISYDGNKEVFNIEDRSEWKHTLSEFGEKIKQVVIIVNNFDPRYQYIPYNIKVY
ncbi:MAG: hypothetical protein WC002_09590 [Candidatus Muiribacteriota bacterium]